MDKILEETDLVVQIASAWQDRAGLVRRQISFARAKELIHRIFDDAGVPRPFVKCIPANYRMQGFATSEHEIFISELPSNATLIEACAQLLLGLSDSVPVQQNFSQNSLYFRNCMALADRYIDNMAHADARRETCLTVGDVHSKWADIQKDHPLYETAVGAGCRIFRRGGEPEPLRDP
ncbi:hypothetical protein [Phyllobacterium sp. K27]